MLIFKLHTKDLCFNISTIFYRTLFSTSQTGGWHCCVGKEWIKLCILPGKNIFICLKQISRLYFSYIFVTTRLQGSVSKFSLFVLCSALTTSWKYMVIDQAWRQDGWILAKFYFVYLWVINWCPICAKWICACRRPSKIRKLIFKNETLYNMNFHIVKCFVLKDILTEQAWSIKDLLYGIKHQNMINVPYRTKPISPVGKTAPSCPLDSQSQCEIWFILPVHGASHIIRENTVCPEWQM